jgi:hypothetical protein
MVIMVPAAAGHRTATAKATTIVTKDTTTATATTTVTANIRNAKQDDNYGASNIILPCPGS